MTRPIPVTSLDDLAPGKVAHALVSGVDLVVVRWPEDPGEVSVLYGRCLHRGALLADGELKGKNLICGLHDWDYCYKTGVSSYANQERLKRFSAWVEDRQVMVDAEEIEAWEKEHPQPFDRDAYQGAYADPHGTPDEPFAPWIQEMAESGLAKAGHHGRMQAMGVPRHELPGWQDLQLLTAQLHRVPLLDEEAVGTELVIGPRSKKPLRLELPLFVSDMSFGALSYEAKVALARGAERAGTGICSGEGGMLPEEQAESSRYFYELASARFGFAMDKLATVQAFHFKCGQGAKTGTGGHLPGHKVQGRIAEVRGLEPGQAAISPSRFPEWEHIGDFRRFADDVREVTGGIPIGFKLSAQHVEKDLDAALEAGADYVILDGRGGGTGAAPLIFRNNISVPTIPALARARRHLDANDARDVTLLVTGGLRVPSDFVKALALGADGIGLSNSALQAIGCLGMRACHTNNCPVGIATQKEELRKRLEIGAAALRLERFLRSATDLMCVLARACGHQHLNEFNAEDLTTWKREMADLSGVAFAGVRDGSLV
ncbi:MAG: alpha-hydroxy-acid oxidizing protein [Deltaproteobacteria bacterium]|nr:alpha-hydroxy-acid oxidizing protein [Deltaproteobacteria bacterium]MBW2394076.1 alpha-hydroxy-acid oxidizing protein [Deltaproteobacteria bacterium]